MKVNKKLTGNSGIDIVIRAIVLLIALVCLYPFVYCISMSFSGDSAIFMKSVWLLPKGFSLQSYELIFKNDLFLISLKNSIVYTIAVTIFSVTGTMLYGYLLSNRTFVFKKFLTVYTLIPMFFGGGLVPSFMLVKSLGLYGSMWALILPSAVSIWNALITKTFIQTNFSQELFDAAYMDGAGHFKIFSKIILPLSKAILAILALYSIVAGWNEYFAALIYLPGKENKFLQVYMTELLVSQETNVVGALFDKNANMMENLVNKERIKYALIVVSSLPIFAMYPILQKYFVKGVMLGSIKG